MKNRKIKSISMLMAAILVIAAMVVPAAAALSAEEQMAANSAAWHIANAAGDKATCDALHEANVALANQAAGSGGSASYNSGSGTWDITTSSGDKITSSGSYSGGKSNTVTYTTTTSSGKTSSTSNSTYTGSSISSYMQHGGTHSGLETSYNNLADKVNQSGKYAQNNAITTAAEETAVVKELLGLTDAEAAKLHADLEASKQAYESASEAYKAAKAAGDTEAAAAARAQMDAAHDAAQATRAEYNYTGDTDEVNDGGYYDDWGRPTASTYSGGGGFYPIGPTASSYTIRASCGVGGEIAPEGRVKVKRGESKAFAITPETGYVVEKVIVDGIDKGSITNYVFMNVQSNHTITASFEKIKPVITASAGAGGSITPSGSVPVDYGSDKSFTITPNEGYTIQSVLVDGEDKGPISGYTFRNVTEAHTISAVFAAAGKIEIGTPSVTNDKGGSISGGSAGDSIKSGYGFYASVPVSASDVTDLKLVMTYNFDGVSKSVTLKKANAGAYTFPVNTASPTGKNCVYIPVATADGSYTLIFTLTAKTAAGEVLTDTKTATVMVKGSMYEDDFVGDS